MKLTNLSLAILGAGRVNDVWVFCRGSRLIVVIVVVIVVRVGFRRISRGVVITAATASGDANGNQGLPERGLLISW